MDNLKKFYRWGDYRSEIINTILKQEKKNKEIIFLFSECQEIVKSILARPVSYMGERPQDFVVASLEYWR